jgi:hypothetical protein
VPDLVESSRSSFEAIKRELVGVDPQADEWLEIMAEEFLCHAEHHEYMRTLHGVEVEFFDHHRDQVERWVA